MNDRELLEMAAKAAGYAFKWGINTILVADVGRSDFCFASADPTDDVIDLVEWSPLTSDGDALRLAVKLGLVVCIMKDAGLTGVYIPAEHIGGKYDAGETYYLTDPYAATRRAIVRAAAEIGRTMKE